MKKIVILVVLFLLIGCSSNQDSATATTDYANTVAEESYQVTDKIDFSDNDTSSLDLTVRKLIRTYTIGIETKDYDQALIDISASITNNNGYIQNYNEYSYNDNLRHVSYTIRIPSENSEMMVEELSSLGKVVNNSNETTDITTAYTDIEARLKTLYIEEATYQDLLAQAESVSDVLEIQNALSDTQYQIENYEAQKRNYDLLTSYDTINLNLTEVEKISIDNQNVFARIKELFTNSISNLVTIVVDAFVFVTGNILYIISIGILILLILKFGKKIVKKIGRKK